MEPAGGVSAELFLLLIKTSMSGKTLDIAGQLQATDSITRDESGTPHKDYVNSQPVTSRSPGAPFSSMVGLP